MNRRALLRTTGAVLGNGALSGCSSLLEDGDGGDADRPATRGGSSTSTHGTNTARNPGVPTDGDVPLDGESDDDRFRWNPAGDAVLQTTVGDPEDVPFPRSNSPVTVRLWNATLSRHAFRIALVVRDSGLSRSRWKRTVTFGPEDFLVLDVADPGDYDLLVYREGQAVGVVELRREEFDCNETWKNVRIGSDRFAEQSFSTLASCAGPGIADATVTGRDADCGTPESTLVDPGAATVSVDDGSVVVDGRVRVPDACYAVTDVATSLDAETEPLVVTVTATEQSSGCQDCTASVPYRAVVAMENAYPQRAVVRHATDGRNQTVLVDEHVTRSEPVP